MKVKVITPPKLRTDAMVKAISDVAHETLEFMMADFISTTDAWEHKVSFKPILTIGNEVYIAVFTLDPIYGYVNYGTKPHVIVPRGPGYPLRFQWGGKGSYRAKTTPRFIGSKPGGPSGPQVAFMRVQHPGIKEPRKFSEEIETKWKKGFKAAMDRVMRDAAHASGHSVP